jgi:hypothetical protein
MSQANAHSKYMKHEVSAADIGATNTFRTPDVVQAVQSTEDWEADKPSVFKEHLFTLCVFMLERV